MAKNKKNDPPPDGLTDEVIANIRENIRKGHSFSSASRLAGVEPGVVFAKVRESPEFQRLLIRPGTKALTMYWKSLKPSQLKAKARLLGISTLLAGCYRGGRAIYTTSAPNAPRKPRSR